MDSLKLKTCELWWNGPKFLMSNQYPQRQIPVAVIKDSGRSITSIAEPDLTNLNENRLDNWQKITKIIQLIWKRWCVDYLNSLLQRNKWHFEEKNAKIGDMVIIKEDNLPSCQWSLGRINNIYPGKDSKVRVVEVKTTRGEKSLENRGRRLGRPRDFCDLPIRKDEGRVVNTPLVFKRVRFQEKSGKEGDGKREEKESGERGAGLGWRKGLSPRLEWKDNERQGR
ncbi:DUF5641 domain-containing protein [Trichonephila clavipes]|nr:DUF5641 domain-containing protein [Trichonephila clavipes]